ncbi:major facilitator superfamily domain-containing protein [Gautieria morchelliformis]|nr:major facilitator superfamily domain-containing protein [Gautieria morchelliformis]
MPSDATHHEVVNMQLEKISERSSSVSPSPPTPDVELDSPPLPSAPKPSVVVTKRPAYFNETTATTAMHVIGTQFNDLANQNWIATAYLIGFTVTQTLLGRFSDIFGRAAVFNGTMVIFAAGTLWCGLAQSMNSLIGGRQTVGVIIIIDLTTPETRGVWLGFFNLSLSLGMAAGPVLGAVLSVDTSWRWLFWITLMIVGITFLIGMSSMRYPVPHRTQSKGIIAQLKEVDYVGSALAVAIAALICIAIEMGNKEFPWNVSRQNPVVDMHLFTIPNIPIACLINFLTGAAYFGAVFFLPRYFIDIFGSSLVNSGLQMLGITLAVGISSVFGANLISKLGQVRLMGAVGGALYALGGGLMFLVGRHTSGATVIGFSVLMGLGSGILYQPSLIVGPMSVKPHQVAGISGFLSFLRTLGGTFATPLLTAIYETSFTGTLRGKIPDNLVNQGLGLADEHADFPQYNNAILDALVKAFHIGNVPAIVFGVAYLVAVVMLRNIDFVPAWRKAQIARREARNGSGEKV